MPIPRLTPARLPYQTPAAFTRPTSSRQAGAQVGYVARPIQGVMIAPTSPTLSDEPLWVRIDDPGSD